MINPKDTLRICGEISEREHDNPFSQTELVAAFDVLQDHAREALPEYAAWVNDVCQNLQGILCERDDGAPTERNLKLAELLARVKHE